MAKHESEEREEVPASITVGNVQIISVTDGRAAVPPSMFFPDKSAEQLAPYKDYLDGDGNLPLRLGSWLIRDGSRTVLVDTGLGTRPNPFGMTGEIIARVAEAGAKAEDIDTVLTTHMHFDHIGGHTYEKDGKDVLAFPNATHPIRETEWAYWTQPDVMAENPLVESCGLPLQAAGKLELVGQNHVITPSVSYIETPGHTPGHVSVLVMSQGKGALILGDVSHTPIQVHQPGWSISADIDGDAAAKTRAAVFDRIAQEGLTLCAGHYGASEGIGNIVEVEGKRRWQGA
jgi:glyoxylase-like metal-dependent hydrolase (beta-lactamase superfamily II)